MSPLPTQRFRPGSRWSPTRRRLYEFTWDAVTVIRPWPQPAAWLQTPGRPWREIAPVVDLSVVERARRRPRIGATLRGRAAAWEKIPVALRRQTSRAALWGHQWPLLKMLTLGPEMGALAEAAPLLAGALATVPGRPRTSADLAHCLGPVDGWRRWRRLAGWLGMDDSRSWVRVLRGVRKPWTWRPDDLRLASSLWHGEGRRPLQHLGTPGLAAVHALALARRADCMNALHPTLLGELSALSLSAGRQAVRTLSSLVSAWRRQKLLLALPPLESLEALHAVHADVLDMLQPQPCHPLTWLEERWPTPPLPGTNRVTPLDSLARQEEEGREMINCVGSLEYLIRAVEGDGYGYHVAVGRTRATVWVNRDPKGAWIVDEIEGRRGRPASKLARGTVDRWLEGLGGQAALQQTPRFPQIPVWLRRTCGPEEIPF